MIGHDEQCSDATDDSSWHDFWTAVPRFGAISEAAVTIRRWLNDPAAGASAVEPARQIALHDHSIEKRLQSLLGDEMN